MFWNYSYVTPSTHARRAHASNVSEAGYYTEEAGWIKDKDTLLKGLEEFFKATGVMPYIYVTNTVDDSHSPSQHQLDEYAKTLYKEKFTDEGHLLLVFLPSGTSYIAGVAYGTQAESVMHAEAWNILLGFLDYNYSDTSYTSAEYLSVSFSDAAERIMSTTVSPWFVLLICLPTIAVVTFFYIRRLKKKREAADKMTDQQVEEMLKIPLEKFGDLEAEKLAKKYEEKT
jgi:hypothetical protein